MQAKRKRAVSGIILELLAKKKRGKVPLRKKKDLYHKKPPKERLPEINMKITRRSSSKRVYYQSAHQIQGLHSELKFKKDQEDLSLSTYLGRRHGGQTLHTVS